MCIRDRATTIAYVEIIFRKNISVVGQQLMITSLILTRQMIEFDLLQMTMVSDALGDWRWPNIEREEQLRGQDQM